jgi:phosphatidylglycerophosphate synthase
MTQTTLVLDSMLGAALPMFALALTGLAAWRAPGIEHARVNREGGSVFLSQRIMQCGYTWIDQLANLAIRCRLSATTVSWLSLLFGAGAGILAGCSSLGAAAWGLTMSGLCDGLDGAIARRTNTTSRWGAVLDSTLDRYVEFFFCLGLLAHFSDQLGAQLVVAAALCGGFMVTYSTAKAEALGIQPPRGWMKRSERVVWFTGGAALAAAARLVGLAPSPLLLATVGTIALFSHLSAWRRLRALAAAC